MRISLISNDIELQKKLEETGYFVVTIDENMQNISNHDAFIISDREIDFNEFNEKYSNPLRQYNDKYIFYMLSDLYNEQKIQQIISISKVTNIIIIPPKLSISQIVNRVIEKLVPTVNRNTNIFTFFGADSKVGTTMIVQSIAERLAQNTDIRVAVLCLNSGVGNYYAKTQEKIGLDDIKIKLINNILSPDELVEACISYNEQLYFLPGVYDLLDVRRYHPEHVDYLIKLASESFHIVMIDAGSNMDSGLAVAALNATKNKYLVTTQQETAKKSYERIESQILKRLHIKSSDFMLIVNKFIKSHYIYSAKQIADIYNMTLATFIPHLEFLGWQAEFDHKSLLHYDNESYSIQMDQLAKLIATQTFIPYREKTTKNQNLFKKALSSIGGFL